LLKRIEKSGYFGVKSKKSLRKTKSKLRYFNAF